MPTKPLLRIAISEEIQKVLDKLKEDFPTMKEVDIVKMSLSAFFKNYYFPNGDEEEAKIKLAKDNAEKMAAEVKKIWSSKNKAHSFSSEEIDGHSF